LVVDIEGDRDFVLGLGLVSIVDSIFFTMIVSIMGSCTPDSLIGESLQALVINKKDWVKVP